MKYAILSHGHAHRPGSIHDVGAVVGAYQERALIRQYMEAMRSEFLRLGWDVAEVSGDLGERQRMGERLAEAALSSGPGAVVYFACHLNKGPSNNGPSLALYDHRSSMGANVASAIVDELGLGGRAQAAGLIPWTRNALATIKAMWGAPSGSCGICLEPLDLANPAHQRLIDNGALPSIGRSIAIATDRAVGNV